MSKEVFLNAPVTEALLDIKVILPPTTNLENLEKFQEKIANEYPYKKERRTWQGGFEVNETGIPKVETPTGGIDGYLFKSANEKRIVQASLDGFTFNMLKPYSRWEDFIQEARNLWGIYVNETNPEHVFQIGLRYINRIEIPLPIHDLKEYILTVPEVSPELPYPLSGYFLRLVFNDPSSTATALLTETVDQDNPIPGILPIILDIDVTNQNLSLDPNMDFWTDIEKMRQFKNTLFFNSLTEKGKELFRK
jgi:uncharacterized protein (TIGR04255 family)